MPSYMIAAICMKSDLSASGSCGCSIAPVSGLIAGDACCINFDAFWAIACDSCIIRSGVIIPLPAAALAVAAFNSRH